MIKTIIAVIVLCQFCIAFSKNSDQITSQTKEQKEEDNYIFTDAQAAYKVLTKLDIFQPVPDSYYMSPGGSMKELHVPHIGLKNDNQYCEKHRAYFVEASAKFFDKMNIIFDINPNYGSLVRSKAIDGIGNDIMPHIGSHLPEEIRNQSNISLELGVNLFFTTFPSYTRKELGQHFSCLTQTSNHIPGNAMLSRKDSIAEAVTAYRKKFQGRPQCLDKHLFPKTWILSHKEDCQDFFTQINSAKYLKNKKEKAIVYIRKIGAGVHRGIGVQPVDNEEEARLRRMYHNGVRCGKVERPYIIQHYIQNPLLLNGHKFDFRVYLLIASTNPFMAYFHDGFLRVATVDYDPSSSDKKSLLTNLVLSEDLYEDLDEQSAEEQRKAQQWSFAQLQQYLIDRAIINNTNWLDEYLRPKFMKAMVHLARIAKDHYLRSSSVYELYGVDFMLDEDLNLWFIEINAGPSYGPYHESMEKFIVKMLADHFEIVSGLLKSRTKRIIKYVNMLIEDQSHTEVLMKDMKKKRREFERISANAFEPEFEPSSSNGFKKIMDEHYKGVKMYQGFVKKACL